MIFFELNPPFLPAKDVASDEDSCVPHYLLFKHQRQAAHAVIELLGTAPRRVLLHMPTGAGKTRTAMNILADHLRQREQGLIVWLAFSEELCEQAVEEWRKAWGFLGNREVGVYRYWGSHDTDLNEAKDGILVAGLSKMYHLQRKDIGKFGVIGGQATLIVIDEAHQAVAPTYSLVLDTLQVMNSDSALLGLSATPGRTWSDREADRKLVEFFNGNKVGLNVPGFDNPIDYLVSEGYIARAVFRSLLYETGIRLSDQDIADLENGLEVPASLISRLVDDQQRNLKVILEVEQLLQKHRRIIVFAASVEHSYLLATALQAKGISAASVTGQTPSAERARMIEQFKRPHATPEVLCNYGVLTTGFDAPQTSAVIIARPTKSLVLFSQMVGRAIRGPRAGGNSEAEIVTVVDYDLPGFGAVAEAFHNWEDVWQE